MNPANERMVATARHMITMYASYELMKTKMPDLKQEEFAQMFGIGESTFQEYLRVARALIDVVQHPFGDLNNIENDLKALEEQQPPQ